MEVSWRGLLTAAHEMLFGVLFLMAIYGVLVELWRSAFMRHTHELTARSSSLEQFYLCRMVVLGWAAVLSGERVIYARYRAVHRQGLLTRRSTRSLRILYIGDRPKSTG